MAHVLLRLWKIGEFSESWLVIAKSVVIGVRTVSNQLNGLDATKVGYNRQLATNFSAKSATIGVHTTSN